MKTSFISSLAMQNSLRTTIAKAQKELTNLNTELTTGKHADIGIALGANTARSLDLTRDIARISAIINTNSIATQRLEASEAALSNMAAAADNILAVLVPNSDGEEPTLSVINQTIKSAFDSFTSFANTSVNGEFLFSGINTDVKPLDDYSAPGSPAKAAFEAELTAFLAAQVPPLASKSDMSPAQMTAFLDDLEAKFNGTAPAPDDTYWETYWSGASDVNMTTRVTQNETVQTSTNTNSQGMRYFAFVSVIATEFLTADMPLELRNVVTDRSIEYIGRAVDGINQQRSQLGLSQGRVTKANESLQAQKAIIEEHLLALEGIDTYEAKTRIDILQAQIEVSYNLTARLQQLSLVNFL